MRLAVWWFQQERQFGTLNTLGRGSLRANWCVRRGGTLSLALGN